VQILVFLTLSTGFLLSQFISTVNPIGSLLFSHIISFSSQKIKKSHRRSIVSFVVSSHGEKKREIKKKSLSISTHELRTKEALASVLRSTLQIGTHEDAVGDYLAAGDFIWLKEKKIFKGGGPFCVQVMMFFHDLGKKKSLGNRLGHQSTWYQLSYFVSNQDVPGEARPIIEDTMLAEFSFQETNVVAHCYSDEIESTARVVHAGNYDSTRMRGLFKTCHAVSRVACGSGYRSSSIDSA
jgi:hypothetical protein